ncbi:MAG: rod shape-determining protein MreC [Acidimicrobiia bacterium]|nr:rod shape-determining protein MreC [Acidimicrobiia bacterium]
MGIYSPARRRLIIALLLTSVLLVTLDLRGNSILDTLRNGFQQAMDPLESAADVVARPVRNAWRGITRYDELVKENEELRNQVEQQRADQISARAAVVEFQSLLELNNLPSLGDIPTITARVVGETPSNFDEVIEIDKGGDDEIEVGMAVVSEGGLVGKITKVFDDRSYVMLVTDEEYAVGAKIPGTVSEETTPTTTPPPPTVPNAIPSPDLTTTTTIPPTTTTTVPGTAPAGEIPTSTAPPTTAPPTTVPVTTVPPTTVPPTTVPPTTLAPSTRETGSLQGQGSGQPLVLRFLEEDVDTGRFEVGDPVMTEGGEGSLAPPDIPIGTIASVRRGAGSAGPEIEVEIGADVERLSFVRVLRFKPLSEAEGD